MGLLVLRQVLPQVSRCDPLHSVGLGLRYHLSLGVTCQGDSVHTIRFLCFITASL